MFPLHCRRKFFPADNVPPLFFPTSLSSHETDRDSRTLPKHLQQVSRTLPPPPTQQVDVERRHPRLEARREHHSNVPLVAGLSSPVSGKRSKSQTRDLGRVDAATGLVRPARPLHPVSL
ncbi:hypothetical protein E2C01_043515 [Portunus trituberculatus]|uniref:Uncharacterized protein n=1 Tax=Portunus trituberculatus TaxID=210409 RepID=A0A5B7FXI9_PORTR|nr:hypothetical protein [Portunus trituberculatus]